MKDFYKKMPVEIPLFLFVSVKGRGMNNHIEKAGQILKANKGRLDDVNRLRVVFKEDEIKNKAVLMAGF